MLKPNQFKPIENNQPGPQNRDFKVIKQQITLQPTHGSRSVPRLQIRHRILPDHRLSLPVPTHPQTPINRHFQHQSMRHFTTFRYLQNSLLPLQKLFKSSAGPGNTHDYCTTMSSETVSEVHAQRRPFLEGFTAGLRLCSIKILKVEQQTQIWQMCYYFLVYTILIAAGCIFTLAMLVRIYKLALLGELLGYCATCIQTMILLPQLLENIKQDTVKGISYAFVLLNTIQDLNEFMFVFVIEPQPIQFVVLNGVQTTVDLLLIVQIVFYKKCKRVGVEEMIEEMIGVYGVNEGLMEGCGGEPRIEEQIEVRNCGRNDEETTEDMEENDGREEKSGEDNSEIQNKKERLQVEPQAVDYSMGQFYEHQQDRRQEHDEGDKKMNTTKDQYLSCDHPSQISMDQCMVSSTVDRQQ